jgi:hypothetical protein
LEDFLNKIPSCPDQDCDLAGACCNVSVIIESCFAGNFKVPGITGQGRAVVGTSTSTESWATYPGGGAYTQGLAEGMRNPDADTNEPPDGVDPMEANEAGKDSVKDNNQKKGKAQKPWQDNQTCDCKCPCKPGINVEKWASNSPAGAWANNIGTEQGQPVRFRIEIENDGKCRDIIDLEVIDSLPGCLEYAGSCIVEWGGEQHSRNPGGIMNSGGGIQLHWDLSDMGALSPGDEMAIEYDAIAQEPGANINVASAGAHCSYDYEVIVSDTDTATVMVIPYEEIPPVEDVLQVGLEVHAESHSMPPECHSTLSLFFWAEDLTGGDYPVTNLSLMVNGELWHNSGSISTTYYENIVEMPVGCGEFFHIEVMATNEVDLIATSSGSITTPIP